MAEAAFRSADTTNCPQHGAGVAGPPAGTVTINGRPVVKIGDTIVCADSTVDPLASGATRVTVSSMFVGRVGERTTHGALVDSGSPKVVIGSPSGCGCPGKLSKACVAMAAGRNPPKGAIDTRNGQPLLPGSGGQSYNNCGLEASRQLIRQATGNPIDQETLFDYAIDNYLSDEKKKARGEAPMGQSKEPAKRFPSGGTGGAEQAAILNDFGVPSDVFDQSPEAIQAGVASGKGVLVWVYAKTLWKDKEEARGKHAILVTGFELGPDGSVVAYIVNDTAGLGCGARVPADKLHRALLTKGVMTKERIW